MQALALCQTDNFEGVGKVIEGYCCYMVLEPCELERGDNIGNFSD